MANDLKIGVGIRPLPKADFGQMYGVQIPLKDGKNAYVGWKNNWLNVGLLNQEGAPLLGRCNTYNSYKDLRGMLANIVKRGREHFVNGENVATALKAELAKCAKAMQKTF